MRTTTATHPIHVRSGNLRTSTAIDAWIRRKLEATFRRFGSRMTAVEVHFEDVNGPRGGADARCLMEARVNGRSPVAVQARASDVYAAIDAAARKLGAAIARVVHRNEARTQRRLRQRRFGRDGLIASTGGVAASGPRVLASVDGDPSAPETGERRGVIIAGFGPVGRALADALTKQGVPITVVDTNPETIRRQEGLGIPVLCGDITDPEVLRTAGIAHAAALAVTIPDSTDAVRACAAARALSPHIHITARTTFLSQGLEAMRAGANSITVEEIATAHALAETVTAHLLQSDDGAGADQDRGPTGAD